MKNTTIVAAHPANIFDDDCELQIFPTPGLTPGSKLKLSFSREFPASLGRASPLPAAKAILKISLEDEKLS
ncbi:MAG: hypothetical protein LBB26_02205 [Puniceicoccales bacterium]|jgi:hypothetical protein|nr:hypothetical protein [Puniceicoccales bacterium]